MTGQSLLENAAVARQVRDHYKRRLQDLGKVCDAGRAGGGHGHAEVLQSSLL